MIDAGSDLRVLVDKGDDIEVHSIAPWYIARCQPRQEKLAKEWLLRFGFEAYYPVGKHYSFVPRRKLPSKTRHKRRMEVTSTERSGYVGYILVRRLWGSFDINRLFDIPHMGGVCCFGPDLAQIADLEVELMRLAEANGAFNTYASDPVRGHVRYHISPEALGKVWTGESRLVGRACESGRLVTFIEHLGRITRVIAGPGDMKAGP